MPAPERNFPFKLKPAVAGEKVADIGDIEGSGTVDQDGVYPPAKDIIVAGDNVTITPDDTAKTLTIASTGGGGGGGQTVTQIPSGTTLPDVSTSTDGDVFLLNEDSSITLWQYTGDIAYNDIITAATSKDIDNVTYRPSSSFTDSVLLSQRLLVTADNLYIYTFYPVQALNNFNPQASTSFGSFFLRRRFLISTKVEDETYRRWYNLSGITQFLGSAVANGHLYVGVRTSATATAIWRMLDTSFPSGFINSPGDISVFRTGASVATTISVTHVTVVGQNNNTILVYFASSTTGANGLYSAPIRTNGTYESLTQLGVDTVIPSLVDDTYFWNVNSPAYNTFTAYNRSDGVAVPARDMDISSLIGTGNSSIGYPHLVNGILYVLPFLSSPGLSVQNTSFSLKAFNLSTGGWHLISENLTFPQNMSNLTLTGSGVPASVLGSDGNSYIDVDTNRFYVKAAGTWRNVVGA